MRRRPTTPRPPAGEATLQDILKSVSVVATKKRRRPKGTRRERWVMQESVALAVAEKLRRPESGDD